MLHDPDETRTAGTPLPSARALAILLHGRGGSAEDMLGLAAHLSQPGVAFLVPQAHDYTWYPQRFLAPLASNEPALGSALGLIGTLLARAGTAGMPEARTLLVGFSQGACLALEFAARHPRRYGGIAGLSGAIIGPPGTERASVGSLEGTPVFLGCSDADVHVPASSVEESARVLGSLGAAVDARIYPGMGHTINEDELQVVAGLLSALLQDR